MRPVVVYVLMIVIGAAAFLYPFWLPATALTDQAHNGDAPLIAALVGALVVAAVALEVRRGTMNGATVALLGVLSASAGLLRLIDLPGGGSGIFFLIVLAGAAFGPRFGLLLGLCSMAVSAIVTGGIGPWLPFQMLALGLDGRRRRAPRPGDEPARSPARGGRARGLRLGVGLPVRGDHEPVVLAVRPRRLARLGARHVVRGDAAPLLELLRRDVTRLGRRRRDHQRAPHPRRGLAIMRTLRRFAHRLDPVVELV